MIQLSPYSVLPLVQAVFATALAVIVLSARRRDRSHVPFGLFLLGIGAWGVLIFLMRTAADTTAALRLERWLVPLALLMAALLQHFAALWTRPGRRSVPTTIAYLQTIVGLASVLGPLVIEGMRRSGPGFTPLPGCLFALWGAACLWPFGLTIARFVHLARKNRDVEERNRVAYILVGVIIAFIGGIFDLAPILGFPGTPGFVIGILVFCGLTTFAILRHDLLDIQAALRSTLAAVLASVVVVVPMLGIAYPLHFAVQGTARSRGILLLSVVIVMALATPPLWQLLRRWIDRRLLGRRWDHLEAIERLIQEIRPLADLPSIARTLVDRLSRFLATKAVSLLAPREGTEDFVLAASTLPGSGASRLAADRVLVRWLAEAPGVIAFSHLEEVAQVQRAIAAERPVLKALQAELLVPLSQHGRGLAGLLVLGPRERGRAYSLEDRRLLAALGGPLAAALDNQRRYTEALRSRGDLERWLNGMSDGVVIVDADRRARFLNAAARIRFAIREGDRCGELAGPEAAPESADSLQSFEFTREGVTWEASAAPLANPDGTTSRIIVVRDQTERQRREQELVRTQRLESLGVLAGGIAHDFNNILTAILGNLELAEREAGAAGSLRQLLNEAEAACVRAKRLTGQLLAFARGGAPVTRAVDIGRLLTETVRFATAGSTAKAEVRVADRLWPALADEGQIGQVVSNLVINAVQAMPRGGTLRVEAVNEPASAAAASLDPAAGGLGFLKITFTDEGIGIAAEHLERVFDPWFTTKPGGSGLGLAVVHEVIRRHHGRVEVVSTPGRGTVFTVWLPASEEASAPDFEVATRKLTGGGRILLMDDEPAVRAVTAAMLEQLGYEVSTAEDGAEAIHLHAEALAAGRPYTAVLLDLTVPGGMGGVEAASCLQAAEPGVRLVATSGYASDDAAARHRDLGFSAFLAKPFTLSDISRTFARLQAG